MTTKMMASTQYDNIIQAADEASIALQALQSAKLFAV
jgi:hypothetical protein